MTKGVALLLVLILLTTLFLAGAMPVLSVSDLVEDSWVSMAPMNVARAYLGVAVVNGKIYAIGGDVGSSQGNVLTGYERTFRVINATEEYDPATDTWAIKASMPTARARFATAAYENKVYCIGGYSGTHVYVGPRDWDYKTDYFDLGVNEMYDPATDTWETKAALPTPRFGSVVGVVDGKIYVIGGEKLSPWVTVSVNEVYDPETDTWEERSPAPQEITSPASIIVDNKICVLGREVLQVFDPANDSWTVATSSTMGSYTAATATTAGVDAPERVYFFDETRTDVFDPAKNSWTSGAVMPTGRLIAAAAVVDDVIYVVGGRYGQHGYMTMMFASAVNERYTPFGYGTIPHQPPPELLSTIIVVIAAITIVAAVGTGMLVYFKKRQR